MINSDHAHLEHKEWPLFFKLLWIKINFNFDQIDPLFFSLSLNEVFYEITKIQQGNS